METPTSTSNLSTDPQSDPGLQPPWYKRTATKRLAIAVAVIAVLAGGGYGVSMLLAGSQSTQNQRAVGGDKGDIITINMIGHWKGEDKREAYVTETLKEFQVQNPKIKVNLKWNGEFPEGRAGALKAVSDQIKAQKTEWDIIWLEPFGYQPIGQALGDLDWGKKHLVDFETVPGFVESQKSFIISDPQYRNHTSGILTGPYIEGFYQPMFYNKEVADLVGVTVKEKNMTYDDFLGYVKAVDAYNKKSNSSLAALYEAQEQPNNAAGGPSTWNLFQSLFRSELSSLEEVKSLEPSAKKNAAVLKAMTSLQELSKYAPLIKNHEQNDWFGTRDTALNNQTLFTSAGASWMYSHWAGIDKTKTAKMYPVEMPVYRDTPFYMGGYNPMFAVMKDSPHREAAIKVLMAFSTPAAAERWVRYAKAPAGIKGNVSQTGQGTDQYDKFITYISDKYAGNIYDSKTVDYVLGEKYRSLTDQFALTLIKVMEGKQTAKAGYDAIMQAEKAIR